MGRPLGGLELRVEAPCGVAADDREHPVGALFARGSQAATTGDSGDWVATGDAGWTDSDGRVWLLGRVANAVGRLYPYEVELAVERLDWVERASMIRLDADGAARAVVAVEPRAGSAMTARECVRAIERLATERQWPIDGVIVRRQLPVVRGPSAKVDTRIVARIPATPLAGLSTTTDRTA